MPAAVIHRQALVHADGSLFGYAVHARVDDDAALLTPTAEDRLVSAAYARVDLAQVVGDRAVVLRATAPMLRGEEELPAAPRSLVVEVPAGWVENEYAEDALVAMRELGFGVALASYTGTLAQRALLPLLDMAKVDLRREDDSLATCVAQLREAGVWSVGLNGDTPHRAARARDLQVDLVQAPLVPRQERGTGRTVTAGEAQHLELVRLLAQDMPDHAQVVRAVSVDPELSLRVLRSVNASTTGIHHHVDSLSRAVALLGPRRLAALVSSVVLSGQPAPVDVLWTVITRALATWRLAGTEVGYTVGLLSGITAALDMSVESVVERSGVSDEVAAALQGEGGPYGPALEAALAHEADDDDAVRAAGYAPAEVARVYFDAMPEALSSAAQMAAPLAA
ncbi:HDOD domain-containing protein [Cellulomonas sp. DKR-3]|uniref:HDOD domain-containing protein n=1 Tax=Cellulomonas fulva TaxID=2835530 RepID=A0ABS5TVA5_9CELL|nr:HDOD domain-containing protein [Cellulomonas fulva]MBT0993092.1 HDOD domain-containing protein [Cellulomonas fulva]